MKSKFSLFLIIILSLSGGIAPEQVETILEHDIDSGPKP